MIFGTFDSAFFTTMAQVGGGAFTLMFAAAQFRWTEWSATRLGKLAAGSALLELLTVTLVSVAIITKWYPLWIITALAATFIGYRATWLQIREFKVRRAQGYFPTPGEEFQMSASALPFASYGVLGAAAILSIVASVSTHWVAPLNDADLIQRTLGTVVAVDIAWLLFSGLTETLVTLSPHLLDPERGYRFESIPLRRSNTHALKVSPPPNDSSGQAVLFDSESPEAVVLLPEIWGIAPQILLIAQGLTDQGYVVLIPDYYKGSKSLRQVNLNNKRIDDALERARVMADEARAFLQPNFTRVSVFGMSMGASIALMESSQWHKVVALYPHDPKPRGQAAVSASNALIVLAEKESREPIAARETALASTFVNAHITSYDTTHSFFAGRSAPWWIRPYLRCKHRAAYSAEYATQAWELALKFMSGRSEQASQTHDVDDGASRDPIDETPTAN